MVKGLEQMFLQKRYTNGQQVYEKMLNIINYQEMQIRMTMRYHLISIRMTIIKKTQKITIVGKDMEKLEPL